jgi:hypothetical protein
MKHEQHDRHGTWLLSIVAVLFIIAFSGCLQSNKSKIIGSWKAQSIDNVDGSIQYTLLKFHKEGGVGKKTGIIIDGELSIPKHKMTGKYKFEEDKKSILITWDDGNSEKTNVSFPQKNKMFLGKYEMEKIMQ